ncbi:endonuclease/exonuclease/phosphatase family protein [Schaalia sp. ZJ405]|uniref:exodeoxyribonuclease III n=1 Tax=Schaalia sp. ZJ405 TaxID=2709403 RepID=UPI0013EE101C|nr:exodeoxyribonuclease III [Schaalia sp. ZJ405]QPK80885.1 endonuclease/exonuclease/phosphatase family protein [Schaalia sp. ZJ405]
MTLRISTVNLNGVRAASKRGLTSWLESHAPAVLLMQEVRADEAITRSLLPDAWDLRVVPSRIKGRAGVAVAVHQDRAEFVGDARLVLDNEESDVDSGRWLETLVRGVDTLTPIRVVSAYFHSGEKDTPKQEAKMAHLPRIAERMRVLLDEASGVSPVESIVCGDFNIVRSQRDIKNWKPNHNKRAGVLDEEIEFLNAWADAGWVDVVRKLAGDVQGPYSWWSWRGQAFVNDAGWRIDYQYATPGIGATASEFFIGRADSYDARFSDHAPVTVDYDWAR